MSYVARLISMVQYVCITTDIIISSTVLLLLDRRRTGDTNQVHNTRERIMQNPQRNYTAPKEEDSQKITQPNFLLLLTS